MANSNTSSELPVNDRIAAAMAEIPNIPKDLENKFSNYWYSSADAVYSVLRPILAKHKIPPYTTELSIEHKVGKKEKLWVWITYSIRFGESEPTKITVGCELTGTQTYGAIRRYAMKYAIINAFLVDTGERDQDDSPTFDHGEVPTGKEGSPEPPPAEQNKATTEQINIICSYLNNPATKDATTKDGELLRDWLANKVRSRLEEPEAESLIVRMRELFDKPAEQENRAAVMQGLVNRLMVVPTDDTVAAANILDTEIAEHVMVLSEEERRMIITRAEQVGLVLDLATNRFKRNTPQEGNNS